MNDLIIVTGFILFFPIIFLLIRNSLRKRKFDGLNGKLIPTPLFGLTLLIYLLFVISVFQMIYDPSMALGSTITFFILIGASLLFYIEQFVFNKIQYSTIKIWLIETSLISIIPIIFLIVNYTPPTPTEFRNDIKISEDVRSELEKEILHKVQSLADSALWPFSWDFVTPNNVESKLLFIYFDSSLTKATLATFTRANREDFKRSKPADDQSGRPYAFYGIKKENGDWVLIHDQSYNFGGFWDRNKAEKRIKESFLRKLGQKPPIPQNDGTTNYKYNYDDVRIFDSYLYDDDYLQWKYDLYYN